MDINFKEKTDKAMDFESIQELIQEVQTIEELFYAWEKAHKMDVK